MHNSTITGAIAGSQDGPAFRKFIVTNLAVQDELVRRRLHRLWGGDQLIKEQDSLALGRQEIRCCPRHLLFGTGPADNGKTFEVGRVHQR